MTATTALQRRFRVLRAASVERMERVVRMQELDDDCFFPPCEGVDNEASPGIILFFSHRWEDPSHPDPTNAQLQAIQSLIVEIRSIFGLFEEQLRLGQERPLAAAFPIARQGTLQALELLFRLFRSPTTPEDFADLLTSDNILDFVGVWYDYMCFPQRPRTELESQLLRDDLNYLAEFVGSARVYLISLRKKGDDFMERAWCVAEVCASWGLNGYGDSQELFRDRYPIALPINEVNSTMPIPEEQCPQTAKYAKEWDQTTKLLEGTRSLFSIASDLVEALQHECRCRALFNTVTPEGTYSFLERGGSDISVMLLTTVTMDMIGFMDRGVDHFDIATSLVRSSQNLHLNCTNGGDIVIAGCMICESMKWAEANEMKLSGRPVKSSSFQKTDLWKRALQRATGGKSIVIRLNPQVKHLLLIQNDDNEHEAPILRFAAFLQEELWQFVDIE